MIELIVDNFAGGGGASLGIEMGIWRPPDIAINHDAEAIAMHEVNHPHTRHYHEDVWHIDPRQVCGGRPVGLAWFSPDCKHHSKAKGGKPVEKKIRGLAWVVIRWINTVRPRVLMLENVEEFQQWGPLTADNKPCQARKGVLFQRWVSIIRGLGYTLEYRELRACDYGSPTIRKRLYVIARCDGLPIRWPEPTHGNAPGLKPYRVAADCIDWSVPVHSIFLTKEQVREQGLRIRRPLADNTMARIARGVWKYVATHGDPFIVHMQNASNKSGVMPSNEPLRTVTANPKGGGMAIAAPFFAQRYGERAGQEARTRPVDAPIQTIVPSGNGSQMVVPHITKFRGDSSGHACNEPLHTVTAGGETARPAGAAHALGLVSSFLAQHNTGMTGHDARDPVSTIVGKGPTQNVVAAHMMPHFGMSVGRSPAEPAGTVMPGGQGKSALVASHLSHLYSSDTGGGAGDVRVPFKTVTAGGQHIAEVRALMCKYYGTGGQWADCRDPMHTLTAKARMGLVTVQGTEYQIVDIGMRMLVPRELYRAQGFPDSYQIDPIVNGKRLSVSAQVRMCGNSVCPQVARAILEANFVNQAVRGAA